MNGLKNVVGLLSLGLLLTVSSCSNSVRSLQGASSLDFPDGIYLIERTGDNHKEIYPFASNERRIRFNKEFIEKTDQDVKYIVINMGEYAPLELREGPKAEAQEDNRKRLMLNLTKGAKEQLKDFTTKHLNKLTTIVVDGEALTMHKIRTVIDGGQLQVTRCTDNACELLYVQLQDNIVKE
ncbi:MAG: hypothetical protein OEQ53_01125 [Saprospiraceae bacterium]|nr:hypothetical protein [Saprospiraceae bacterium]